MTKPSRAETSDLGFVEFVCLMASMMSLVALALDAMLPVLTALSQELGFADAKQAQWVIISLFLGLGLAMPFAGSFSDRFGRKPVLLVGLGVFVLGSGLSYGADSVEWMLFGRFLQGLGAGAPRVVSMAIIRDRYQGRLMAKVSSFVMTLFILVPVFAPSLGAVLANALGWRSIFAAFALLGLGLVGWMWWRLPEPLAPERRRPLSWSDFCQGVRETLTHRITLAYTLVSACVFSPFLAYLASSPQIFQGIYGKVTEFPLIFGALAVAVGMASLLNAKLVMWLGMRFLAHLALGLLLGLSLLMLLLSGWLWQGVPPFTLLLAYLASNLFLCGLLFGNVNAVAMEPMGHRAGLAASVIGAVSTLLAVLGASAIARFDPSTLLPLIGGFVVFSALGLLLCWWAQRGLLVGVGLQTPPLSSEECSPPLGNE